MTTQNPPYPYTGTWTEPLPNGRLVVGMNQTRQSTRPHRVTVLGPIGFEPVLVRARIDGGEIRHIDPADVVPDSRPTTASPPLALHVPEHFTYVDRGLQRASDWIEYQIHPGLYRIGFTTVSGNPAPGNTRDQARELANKRADEYTYPIDRTALWPYYAVATLTATKVRSYYQNQLFGAVSGHEQEHDEVVTLTWHQYAYTVQPDATCYREWIGQGAERRLVHHATIVEMQPCEECEAAAGERCEEGCQGGWDGVAPNAGSAG